MLCSELSECRALSQEVRHCFLIMSTDGTLAGVSFLHVVEMFVQTAYAKEIAQNGEAAISPLSFNTARAIIKREIKDPPPKHPIVSKAYEHLSIKEEKKIKTRKEAALLAQLRSGHCKELRAYQHRIDESKDETCPCPRCQLEAEDVQHWLACPATIMKRQSIFGDDDVPLGMMTQQPELVLAYAKETLLC